MRDTSMIQTGLNYATFLSLSIALHVVVILGNRPLDTLTQDAAAAAPVAEERGGERVK